MTTVETRQLAIDRLTATIEKMKTLQPEEFNYSSYVSKSKNGCGTVCCVAGWYPKWFPESNVKWETSDCGKRIIGFTQDAADVLARYHKLSIDAIDGLFYGFEYYSLPDVLRYQSEITLTEVLERFETVRDLLATGNYDEILKTN